MIDKIKKEIRKYLLNSDYVQEGTYESFGLFFDLCEILDKYKEDFKIQDIIDKTINHLTNMTQEDFDKQTIAMCENMTDLKKQRDELQECLKEQLLMNIDLGNDLDSYKEIINELEELLEDELVHLDLELLYKIIKKHINDEVENGKKT